MVRLGGIKYQIIILVTDKKGGTAELLKLHMYLQKTD